MEDGVYSNLGFKQKKSSFVHGNPSEELGLAQVIDEFSRSNWQSFSEKRLLKSLVYEFKTLLETDNLKELAQDLVQVDHHLHLVLENVHFSEMDIDLKNFYQNLSILFIRMALEEDVTSDSMKRAIEIALEEEIYTWQDRLQ